MENGPPDGNFEAQLNSGEKFTYSSTKGTWTSSITGIIDPTRHPEYRFECLFGTYSWDPNTCTRHPFGFQKLNGIAFDY
jgi:hypothetical protein